MIQSLFTPAGPQPEQLIAPVSPSLPSPWSPSLSSPAVSSQTPIPASASHIAPNLVSLQLLGSAGPERSLKPGKRRSPLYPETLTRSSAPGEKKRNRKTFKKPVVAS